jgi:hypothetical protein
MHLIADPALVVTVAAALALLFSLSGSHKLRAPAMFRAALDRYALLSPAGNAIAVLLVPAVELGIALGLMHPQTRPIAAIAAAGVLVLYGLVMARAMWRGQDIMDCGCSLGPATHPVQWPLVWRNALLAACALLLALPFELELAPARELSAYDVLTIGLAVVMASLLYTLSNTLIANHHRQPEFRHD